VASIHPPHIPGLDGIRGLAILLVLFFHTNAQVIYRLGRSHDGDILSRFMSWMADQGARGVDLFFVLSGFLITGILLANPRCRSGNFF